MQHHKVSLQSAFYHYQSAQLTPSECRIGHPCVAHQLLLVPGHARGRRPPSPAVLALGIYHSAHPDRGRRPFSLHASGAMLVNTHLPTGMSAKTGSARTPPANSHISRLASTNIAVRWRQAAPPHVWRSRQRRPVPAVQHHTRAFRYGYIHVRYVASRIIPVFLAMLMHSLASSSASCTRSCIS